MNEREKDLWTLNAVGTPIALSASATEHEEARFVADEIVRLVHEEEFSADECMTLFRTNQQARALEQALIHVGLPYTIEGQTSFFNLKEVKDVLAYLSLAYNPENALALERVINTPPRKLGAKALQTIKAGEHQLTLTRILEALHDDELKPAVQEPLTAFHDLVVGTLYEAADQMPLTDLFDLALDATGYKIWIDHYADSQKRHANLTELRLLTYRYHDGNDPRQTLGTFLNDAALMADTDPIYVDHGGVKLITIHTAKGLEARAVFLTGLEEGIFPHHRSLGTQSELNEERRVFYVGITRAMERLYLTYARTRTGKDGRVNDHAPSRFLREVPRHLIERLS
ncbi:MAG: 3'-5' exonuclease [Chloroflexota bacterium]